jgi:hypothetical protein
VGIDPGPLTLRELFAEIKAWVDIKKLEAGYRELASQRLNYKPNPEASKKQPAGDHAPNKTVAVALAIIRAEEGRGLVAKEIVRKLSAKGIKIEETTFRKHIVPQLKAQGIKNQRARGGYFDATRPGTM